MRRTAVATALFTGLVSTAVIGAAPASAGAFIEHPQCGFTAGSFPGVDVEIIASRCQVVHTPAGRVNAYFVAQVPKGYTIEPGVTRDGPCRVTVTPSRRITATCHFG
jgi:hypothetical protein